MTDWHPACNSAVAVRRSEMLRRIREYFESKSVLEVDTPALGVAAISDVQIESLEVSSALCDRTLYLHTSPEFMMKRLLAASWPDLYAICRVFRDGESGTRHQPEFTMLEWYRLGFDLDAIIGDTLSVVASALNTPALANSASVINYRDAIARATGLDPAVASIDELAIAADADIDLRHAMGDERDDWLDLLMTSKVAPAFATDRLTVVRHYPSSQAALARLCPDDSSVADRFEVFMGTLELGNGYVELTDASELASRISADQAERQRRGRRQRPPDQALLDAMRHGLPDCAGVAVGIERLQMVLEKTDDIRMIIPFAFEKPDE